MQGVRQNINSLKQVYLNRLSESPGLEGTITAKWHIDEYGNVLFCKIINSTLNDPKLEADISKTIKQWSFGKIDKPGDVTEVIYPFILKP